MPLKPDQCKPGSEVAFVDGDTIRTFTVESPPIECANGPWIVRGYIDTQYGSVRCTMDLSKLYVFEEQTK